MNISWADFWSVCKDYILPESSTLVLSVLLYGILGFVIAVAILALGQRYGVFARKQKYYNWIVKLYIPLILLGTLYFALQIGLFRGIYKVMDHETDLLTEGIYGQTVDRVFSNPAEKAAYLELLKVALVTYDHSSAAFADSLKHRIMGSQVGYGVIDQAKNKVSAYLIDTFKDDIFNAILAAVLSEASKQGGAPVEMSWSESRKLLEILQHTDAARLEVVIKAKVTEMLQHLFYTQYSSLRKSSLLMWFVIALLLPMVEWLVYLKWIAPWLDRRSASGPAWTDQSINAPR
jgi:hypothetical protein